MADVKISALPVATTPVAGTEVLPIVQSSTTKQVSIANLTAGRAVSASSLTLTTPLTVANGGTGITSFGTGVATALGNAVNSASGICVQDASGNLGLGVTPSAQVSSRKSIAIGGIVANLNYASAIGETAYNFYWNGTNNVYQNNGYAGLVDFNVAGTGQYRWFTSSSGTAGGTVSFTQAMTLDASGNLGVGNTSQRNVSGYASIGLGSSNGGLYDIFSGTTRVATFGGDGGSCSIGSIANVAVAFTTNNTERACIDTSGNLLVGTTSTLNSSFTGVNIVAGAPALLLRSTGATSGKYWRTSVDTGNAYIVSNNGGVGSYLSDGATTWSGYSDARLKNIIALIDSAVTKVNSLRPVIYSWKSDDNNTRRVGLIAQDVQKVLPEAVSEMEGHLGLAYSDVIPLLTAAIQELAAKVSALEAKQ